MGDPELVEWLAYVVVGLCALAAHSALTVLR